MTDVIQLENGISVVLEEMPYCRTASVGVWVFTGSALETKKNNGISHMIEHMLFKGTTHRTAKQIAEATSRIGDNVNAYTSKEITCYYGTTVTDSLSELVDLLSDMFQNSVFSKEDIRKEKRVICDEIDMYEDSPEDLVHELLQKAIYKKHPLGYIISGSKSNVRSFTREEIIMYWKEHYRFDNILISVAGNFEKEALINQLCTLFIKSNSIKNRTSRIAKGIKENRMDSIVYQPHYTSYANKPVYHSCFCTKDKDIEQLHMNLAFPAISLTSEKNYIFTIFNSILGGSNNSRLFQKIREELGLTYSICSYGSSFFETGLLHIDLTVHKTQAERVFDAIIEQIKMFVTIGISQEELKAHRSQVITEYIMSCESVKARMNTNARSFHLHGRIRSMDEVVDGLSAVTCDEIHLLARQIFDLRKISMCLVGSNKDNHFYRLKRKWKKIKEEAYETL